MTTENNTLISPQLVSELINFWWPNANFDTESAFDFWFDKTPDDYIKTKYQFLVDSDELAKLVKFDELTNKTKLALLLVGDQFTRNIYRDSLDNINYKKHDNWCLKLALAMIQSDEDLQLNLNMRYFILLPLRHQNKTYLLEIVRNRIHLYIKSYTDQEKSVPQSLIKFYAHTIKNYTYLLDTIKIVTPLSELSNELSNEQTDFDILDDNCSYWFDNGLNSSLLALSDDKHIIYKTLKDWLSLTGITSIGISLSGGVDSMVLLTCFAMIKQSNPTLLEKIVAIHIEHSNRLVVSVKERDFLSRYCTNLGVKFYYRTIDYMNRTTPYLDRDIYETESKKLRFNLYNHVCDIEDLYGICIGHHMGDITENVFTNIIKGRINEDLGQMKQSDNQFDCQIYRPFLNLIKDNIFDFAHKYHVPYFKNSTPVWSCRGVIRDKMIPILKAQFGDFEPNIINFMNTFKEMSELNNKFVIKPYIDSMIKLTYGYKIPFNKDMILDIVWDQILINITHSNGYHMVSTKSKMNLLNWLKGIIAHKMDSSSIFNDYKLSKQYIVYYEKTNDYLYFIDYVKLSESEIVKTYKNSLVKVIDGKKCGQNITLDQLLNNQLLGDGLLGNQTDANLSNIYVDKKKIKITQQIKKLLFE